MRDVFEGIILGLVVSIIIAGFGYVMFSMGTNYGHRIGYMDGCDDGWLRAHGQIERQIEDSIGHCGTYYGYDGVEIQYNIVESDR